MLLPWRALVLALASLASPLAGCASSTIGSVGAVLGVDNETGAVYVRETREGAAADKAGLVPGDEILMIDGVYAREMGTAAIRDRLRGTVGTSVQLTVVRGDEVLHVKLVRQPLAAAAPPQAKEERIAP